MPPRATVIPASWVKRRPISYWMEELQAAGLPLCFGRLELPPPCLGHFVLFELSGNSFFASPRQAGAAEAARAVAILLSGRALYPAVAKLIGDDFGPINEAMKEVLDRHHGTIVEHYDELAAWIREVPFYGFDMIPKSGDAEPDPFLFAGPIIGAIALTAVERLGCPYDEALWSVPVCAVGHLQAAHLRAQNEKGIRRPDDHADIRLQLKLARERNERGEPHPWDLGLTREEWDARQAAEAAEEKE